MQARNCSDGPAPRGGHGLAIVAPQRVLACSTSSIEANDTRTSLPSHLPASDAQISLASDVTKACHQFRM
jgi:hypothetical protein